MAMDRLHTSNIIDTNYSMPPIQYGLPQLSISLFSFVCFLLVLASHAYSCHPCFFFFVFFFNFIFINFYYYFFFYYDRLLIPEIRFLIADCACLFALQPGVKLLGLCIREFNRISVHLYVPVAEWPESTLTK